jgi:hypothetical protein
MFARYPTLALLCLFTLVPSALWAADPARPTGRWSGKVNDKALRTLAPQAGFLADQATWKKVWSAWRPGQELPKVDFARELILVGTVPGPNRVIMRPTINSGNVRFLVAGTKIGGPGFGYQFLRISKEGVKSVNGKPIDARGVQGVLVIPRSVASFTGHTVEIKLWEYDPRLADVSATLIDSVGIDKFRHQQGKDSETTFAVGTKLKPRPDRRYYITVFVLNKGKRTHIADKDGKPGLCNVLTQGNPTSVKMIARPVR